MPIDVSVFRVFSGKDDKPTQSYRLHLANLEDQPLEYLVEYWHRVTRSGVRVTAQQFHDVRRTYSPEASVFVATLPVHVLPHEAVVVRLAVIDAEFGDLDVGGHVRLRLPRRAASGVAGGLRLGPQLDRPARVMLQAESVTRTTPSIFQAGGIRNSDGYVIARFGTSGALSPLETATALALASGNAFNEVPPDGLFTIDRAALEGIGGRVAGDDGSDAGAVAGAISGATADLPDADRARALVELLAEVRPDEATVKELNRLLGRAKAGIQVGGVAGKRKL